MSNIYVNTLNSDLNAVISGLVVDHIDEGNDLAWIITPRLATDGEMEAIADVWEKHMTPGHNIFGLLLPGHSKNPDPRRFINVVPFDFGHDELLQCCDLDVVATVTLPDDVCEWIKENVHSPYLAEQTKISFADVKEAALFKLAFA